jgi:hypothetical protein
MKNDLIKEEWPITGGRRTKHPQVEESLQIYKLLF